MEQHADLAIVGAGIIGLAHAYHAARKGLRVVVFERSLRASGASIRNLGMIWPIGQPHGFLHQLALRSREHWLELLQDAGLPYRADGSLHLVYKNDEAAVAREFAEIGPGLGYECAWLNAEQVLSRSNAVRPQGLLGGIWSNTEITVDPRVTLARLPQYLQEKFGVEFQFGCSVHSINLPTIDAGGKRWKADRVIVCSGDDFESLYPHAYANSGIDRVKLQMLRTESQPQGWRLGPALAAGLTLRFYQAFAVCSTLPALKQRIAEEMPEYEQWGIHGLVSQTSTGELTLGDSHEYGLCVDIFNKQEVDELILRYISGFLQAPSMKIAQRWYGVYAKHPEKLYLSLDTAPGVKIVTSPGGAGMTLAFGVAERTVEEMGL
ncbi:MAG TPA: TIGR03364 family FAD-dependent oxidoreductase [Candidatus Angelobacter sp.]|nr:TIGR03364 family FAD-dependent oxidoreductase [Candidatus Angelobacter sp.]